MREAAADCGGTREVRYEAARRCEHSVGGRKIPAVAVTAFARSEDRIRALQAGYNLNVAKPLESREIVAVIAALVVSIPPQ